MRYHAMAHLLRFKSGSFTETERYEFQVALRDWYNFCINEENHFMFQEGQDLKSPEEEIQTLFRGDENPKAPLVAFFLNDKAGRRFLDHQITNWYLRERYDWWGASGLAWERAKNWFAQSRVRRWLGYAFFGFVTGLILGALIACFQGYATWLQIVLLTIYSAIFVGFIVVFFWRTVLDLLLLPRLLAAIGVGYLPLFVTSALWELPYKLQPSYRLGCAAGAVVLSFTYLLWLEVHKKLSKTQELSKWLSRWRAFWILVLGCVISSVIGLVILDVVGGPLGRASYKGIPCGVTGIFGVIHWPILLFFAPFALLIGVILQIFWEEKPITQPD